MKAILVIDKPESCTRCLLGIYYNKGWFCLATNKDIDVTDRYNIPECCPLKPMPKKMNTDGDDIEEDSYWQGWNDCIEEITDESNISDWFSKWLWRCGW